MSIVTRHYAVVRSAVIRYGLGYGAVAAMILSWSHNHSILWMLIHGWLNWIYVIYAALFH